HGIRYRSDVTTDSCCAAASTINLAFSATFPFGGTLDNRILAMARWTQVGGPSCTGTGDHSFVELGARGALLFKYEWDAFHSGSTFYNASERAAVAALAASW